jgi:hypothetical protein
LVARRIGEAQQPSSCVGWNFEVERPGGWKIDNELEPGRLHDRQVRRGGALEDTTHIDAEFGITMDVEERFEIKPAYLAADTAYGSADALNWIVNEKKIAPHIPVNDKSKSEDGTSREKISVRRLALHRRARGVLALEHARGSATCSQSIIHSGGTWAERLAGCDGLRDIARNCNR